MIKDEIEVEGKIDLWLAHDAATDEMVEFCSRELSHRAAGAHRRAQHYADLYEAAQINHDAWLDLLFPIDSECGHDGADGPMCAPCAELARRYEGDAPGEGSAAQHNGVYCSATAGAVASALGIAEATTDQWAA